MTTEPIHILSLGAGVQSSTLALMAAVGEVTPMPAAAIFADTQAEPASVYRWLDWLEKQLPFPVHRVTAGNLEILTLIRHKRKDGKGEWVKSGIPHYTTNIDGSCGHGRRQCTRDFKLKPILKKQRELVDPLMTLWRRLHKRSLRELSQWKKAMKVAKREHLVCPMRPEPAWQEVQFDPLIVSWIGISTDEASRMKESRVEWIISRWPLIEAGISRKDCLTWMKGRGFPTPPRSACVFCPYHSDDEWLRLKREEPAEFLRAVAFERAYQIGKVETVSRKGFMPFLHDSRVNLDLVNFVEGGYPKSPTQFGNECEGMCGV